MSIETFALVFCAVSVTWFLNEASFLLVCNQTRLKYFWAVIFYLSSVSYIQLGHSSPCFYLGSPSIEGHHHFVNCYKRWLTVLSVPAWEDFTSIKVFYRAPSRFCCWLWDCVIIGFSFKWVWKTLFCNFIEKKSFCPGVFCVCEALSNQCSM